MINKNNKLFTIIYQKFTFSDLKNIGYN